MGESVIAIVGSNEGISEGSLDGVNDVAKLGSSVGDVEDCIDGRAEEGVG